MKCEIIRDLLPSYVDGLTSEESNREIAAHVAECAPCKEILEQMQEEVQEKAPKEKRKINPFRKFNRRMMSAVAVAVVICIGVGGFGYKAFARGFAINPQEITMEPKLEGDMLYLNFSVEKGGLTNVGSFYDSEVASISLRNVWKLPGEEQASKEYCWGMNLNMLKIGSGERMNVQLKNGGLAKVELPDENSVTITNGNETTTGIVMFQEGDSATTVAIGDREKVDLQEYNIKIDFGNETKIYTLQELIDMAEK